MTEALGLTLEGEAMRAKWLASARAVQLPTDVDWDTWLMDAGRGYGKTRAAAERLADRMRTYPNTRWAIVAPTQGDVRDICFEGESGLLSVLDPAEIARHAPMSVELTNGSRVSGYGASND